METKIDTTFEQFAELATGGTLEAAIQLLSKLDVNICGAACIIELIDLKGKENINCPFNSLISY